MWFKSRSFIRSKKLEAKDVRVISLDNFEGFEQRKIDLLLYSGIAFQFQFSTGGGFVFGRHRM